MKYYKVVRNINNKLYSCITYNWAFYDFILDKIPDVPRAKFVVEYRIGEFVSPKIEESKLFVFLNLESAESFFCKEGRFIHDLEIYECEIDDKCEDEKSYFMGSLFRAEDKFLNNINHSFDEDYIDGTVFCEKVKLLRKVI